MMILNELMHISNIRTENQNLICIETERESIRNIPNALDRSLVARINYESLIIRLSIIRE